MNKCHQMAIIRPLGSRLQIQSVYLDFLKVRQSYYSLFLFLFRYCYSILYTTINNYNLFFCFFIIKKEIYYLVQAIRQNKEYK